MGKLQINESIRVSVGRSHSTKLLVCQYHWNFWCCVLFTIYEIMWIYDFLSRLSQVYYELKLMVFKVLRKVRILHFTKFISTLLHSHHCSKQLMSHCIWWTFKSFLEWWPTTFIVSSLLGEHRIILNSSVSFKFNISKIFFKSMMPFFTETLSRIYKNFRFF